MTLKATVATIGSDSVTIKLPDGQILNVQLSAIHGTPKVGSDIHLLLSTGIADRPETQDLARALLNELMGTDPSKESLH